MIFHIIRNSRSVSLFKEIILHSLHHTSCDKVYLSSGFFNENPAKNEMSKSLDKSNQLNWLNVPNRNNITVYVKGSFSRSGDMTNLVNNLNAVGFNAIQLPYKHHHHAKVFIAEEKGLPFLEIIGSSNFTTAAYGTNAPFNIEADLVISLSDTVDKHIYSQIENFPEFKESIMILEHNKENNFNRSLQSQMIWIRDNLF